MVSVVTGNYFHIAQTYYIIINVTVVALDIASVFEQRLFFSVGTPNLVLHLQII